MCKQSSGTPAATGNFQFTVTDSFGAVTPVTVAVGLLQRPDRGLDRDGDGG